MKETITREMIFQLKTCKRCGDLIGGGTKQMNQHLEWCMIPGKDVHAK